jgi:alpha-1,3-mannosyltransferase
MRVLHVVRQFHPSVGGLEGIVRSLSLKQRSAGIDAEVLTLDRVFRDRGTRLASRDLVDGIPVRRVSFFGSRRYPISPALLKHVAGYDLVHVHGVDFICDYLALTAPIHRRPLVISTHGGFFHTTFARRFKRIYFNTATRAALTRYSRVFACSKADLEMFEPISGHRLRLVANGTDIEKFAGASAVHYKPSFVYFGRFASHKGLEKLLDAFEVVLAKVPDARLKLIGTDWDGTLARLQARRERGLRDAVEIKTDLSDADIAAELKDCSFFVSGSEYEGFGLALVEALSAGLVPIVSPIPSFQAIVRDAGVGSLTDFSDPVRAGSKIAEFVERQEPHYSQLRMAAMSAAGAYGWDEVERRYRDEYESVLGLTRRTILGVSFEPMHRDQAVAKIDDEFERGQSQRVAFANAHTLNVAKRNADFRDALKRFLVLNDGIGADIASRIKFGKPFPDNLNGTDFVPHYLRTTRHPLRIFLIGSRSHVVSEVARRFAVMYPKHSIVGTCDGYFRDEAQINELCGIVRNVKADLLLVALGNPLQEMWIAKYGPETGAKIQMGVGALFDFTADRVPRAPLWVRRMRCEWMYRLACEPRRLFTRYVFGGFVFLRHVLGDKSHIAP